MAQASRQSDQIVEMDEPNQSVAQHSHQSDQVDEISKQEMPDVPMGEEPTQSVALPSQESDQVNKISKQSLEGGQDQEGAGGDDQESQQEGGPELQSDQLGVVQGVPVDIRNVQSDQGGAYKLVKSQNLPVGLVNVLPVELVNFLPGELVNPEGYLLPDELVNLEYIFLPDDPELQGDQLGANNDDLQGDQECKRLQGDPVHMKKSEIPDCESVRCAMCCRSKRLVQGVGHWGRQVRNVQCVQEIETESECEEVPKEFTEMVRGAEKTKRKNSLLKKRIHDMKTKCGLCTIVEEERNIKGGHLMSAETKSTAQGDHTRMKRSDPKCVKTSAQGAQKIVTKCDTHSVMLPSRTHGFQDTMQERYKENINATKPSAHVQGGHKATVHTDVQDTIPPPHLPPPHLPPATQPATSPLLNLPQVQGVQIDVQTDQLPPHPPHRPPATKKSPEKLRCFPSNTDWSLRPGRGALRYLGVITPRGTTLCNVELCSGLNTLSKVRTESTTTSSPITTNHHCHQPPFTTTYTTTVTITTHFYYLFSGDTPCFFKRLPLFSP